jgi:hypothetical protein
MTASLNSLKREITLIAKSVITDSNVKERSEQIEKLLFFNEKLIQFIRICDTDANGDMIEPDAEKLAAFYLEITNFNKLHPVKPNDIIKWEPEKSVYPIVFEKNNGE